MGHNNIDGVMDIIRVLLDNAWQLIDSAERFAKESEKWKCKDAGICESFKRIAESEMEHYEDVCGICEKIAIESNCQEAVYVWNFIMVNLEERRMGLHKKLSA